jgi:hypothetical protein
MINDEFLNTNNVNFKISWTNFTRLKAKAEITV